MSKRLQGMLRKIIDGEEAPKIELRGGLLLQFRQDYGEMRLLAYRCGDKEPSTPEYAILRRELEAVVGGEVELDRKICYLASDGRWRTGRAFVWKTEEIWE